MTLTGAEIKEALEEQFAGCAPEGSADVPTGDRRLAISEGFSFTWDRGGAPCHKIERDSMRLGGVPLEAAASYRVTVNDLLAGGGDQIPVFAKGRDRVSEKTDLDALVAYFGTHSPVAPPKGERVRVER